MLIWKLKAIAVCFWFGFLPPFVEMYLYGNVHYYEKGSLLLGWYQHLMMNLKVVYGIVMGGLSTREQRLHGLLRDEAWLAMQVDYLARDTDINFHLVAEGRNGEALSFSSQKRTPAIQHAIDQQFRWRELNGLETRVCHTPGTMFHHYIDGSTVTVVLELPFEVPDTQAERLDDNLHDHLEEALRFMWEDED